MYIKNLKLKNIGPFYEANMDFTLERDTKGLIPVTIITGENGTGKSIIIDSLRAIFMGYWGIERKIISNEQNFEIEVSLDENNIEKKMWSSQLNADGRLHVNGESIERAFSTLQSAPKLNYLVEYWSPDLSTDSFDISNISIVDTSHPHANVFSKTFKNSDINQFICFVDYLRGSLDPNEQEIGKVLYSLVSSMISDCLADGIFSHVSRLNLKPVVKVRGRELTIEKLSMGNLLLLTHFVKTLYRMYGICMNQNIPIQNVNQIAGFLLIDEIENHLHPKWQKKVIGLIRKYFPNLQLIVTTHSPFVVTSVSNPTIYVCESRIDHSEVHNVSVDYAYPVDEVLNSPVFDVGPFSETITDLLRKRHKAVEEGNKNEQKRIEDELLSLNEEYFSYYNLANQLNIKVNEAY